MKRIFVEKQSDYQIESATLLEDLKVNLKLPELSSLRVLYRYDFEDLADDVYNATINGILSEPPVDKIFENTLPLEDGDICFAIEYLPGQFDQRADSASQCIQILTQKTAPIIVAAKVIVLQGNLSIQQIEEIKKYCINPVDSREANLDFPESLLQEIPEPQPVASIEGFLQMSSAGLEDLRNEMGLAMSNLDLEFTQKHYKEKEQRNPTLTEIKALDTYWSDHCRHTTFLTAIEKVTIQDGIFNQPVKETYAKYKQDHDLYYGENVRAESLMDIALLATKKLRKAGKLDDLEVSEEINACSIVVPVKVNGEHEDWLVMFKNETHNHPTEIEPFGGAATCLGGCIRDPLSGRSFVYQAMRVTGAADPRQTIEETLPGKLTQKKITTEAAHGYSSYGNQIGLATGLVSETYHPNYVAKRLEVGAVIAASPKENVRRESPLPGDKIVLLGGKTGRDGVGGATGSSKEHTETALENSAEVQKGNPPTERKIQRLFRNKTVSQLIKKCNDFGAGGVSVAIGELAPSLEIYLDRVPLKYHGLDGTELAISESQERMAVVLEAKDVEAFIQAADKENLEAVEVADVTDTQRLRIHFKGQVVVDLEREFLDSNGVPGTSSVSVQSAKENYSPWANTKQSIEEQWPQVLSDLNNCSQQGLIERFDSTIGASAVLHPFGGKFKKTPAEGMASKIPVIDGDCDTATLMTHGFDPYLTSWSPFHGALYAELHSVAKLVAMGGNYKNARLTLQEYFKKLGEDAERWGEPFAALLGAYWLQDKLEIPAIGGKDSMSGSFKDIDVPPTFVSFAVATMPAEKVVSSEFKKTDSQIILLPVKRNETALPDLDSLLPLWDWLHCAIDENKVLATHTIGFGGIATALSKMSFGNQIGIDLNNLDTNLFSPDYGSIIVEIPEMTPLREGAILLGKTQQQYMVSHNGSQLIDLQQSFEKWEQPLEKIFPQQASDAPQTSITIEPKPATLQKATSKVIKPRVIIPVFPGTNCEYDTANVFRNAGAEVETLIFRNQTASQIEESLIALENSIKQSQILMLAGGFSAGDEPDGSGKFIATVFRNSRVADATMDLLKNRDGLALGICNGFQALIKLGLVPYGEIRDMDAESPTLTFNNIGRHVSSYVETKIASTLSPWLSKTSVGDIHSIAVSHGEGKFVAPENVLKDLASNGQIATQYVDGSGTPSLQIPYNPNGSYLSVEGITSKDGRILGKMGHSERLGASVAKNISGNKDQTIFSAGVEYFI